MAKSLMKKTVKVGKKKSEAEKVAQEYKIALSKIISELSLEEKYTPDNLDEIEITSRDVNRPGIELNGFFDFFDKTRITVIGKGETAMLESFGEEKRNKAVSEFFAMKPPAIIIARGIQPDEHMLATAEKYEVPLLLSEDTTSNLVAALVAFLNVRLAPRVTRHGVLVEVYGEGILLLGDSGVGKSETAIELIKRGHRLIADDAVEIRRVSNKSLVGQAPENIRYFIELRGIGIINARRIFGMGAVKVSEKIDLCISMEQWDSTKLYDRMGMDNETTEILGLNVPIMTIPVKPGRNLAVIIEVAAMNHRQKKMGYNATKELLAGMGMDMSAFEK
jgi:Hpr(Ser) kinase/phosphatase